MIKRMDRILTKFALPAGLRSTGIETVINQSKLITEEVDNKVDKAMAHLNGEDEWFVDEDAKRGLLQNGGDC